MQVLNEMTYTVRARIEIGKLAGGHSMKEFFDTLGKSNDEEKTTNLLIDAVEIMHNAWLRKQAQEKNEEFAPAQLDREAFMDLTTEEWNKVENAILEQIKKDSGVTIETEPVSKKKEIEAEKEN